MTVSYVSALLALLANSGPVLAQDLGCFPPVPPFVPSDPLDVRAYADLIRDDFEAYISEFQAYLRCLDTERARAFQEGQDVTRDYGRFQQLVQRLSPAPDGS